MNLSVMFCQTHPDLHRLSFMTHSMLSSVSLPSPSSWRPHGQRLQPGHRRHRGHPGCHLPAAAGGCRRHVLLPQQVWPPHVHCRQLLRQAGPQLQEQGHRGGEGRFYVSGPRWTSPRFHKRRQQQGSCSCLEGTEWRLWRNASGGEGCALLIWRSLFDMPCAKLLNLSLLREKRNWKHELVLDEVVSRVSECEATPFGTK